MKQYLVVFLIVTAFLFSLISSVQADTSISPTGEPSVQKQPQPKTTLTALQAKGDTLIVEQLATLTSIRAQVNAMSNLDITDKTAMEASITKDTQGLQTLKTKIDADTNITTVQTDIHAIDTSYRIYTLLEPQADLFSIVDTMTTATSQLTDLSIKLQNRIQDASQSGIPVSSMTPILADMQQHVASASDRYTNTTIAISGLTPVSYNTNPGGIHGSFVNAENMFKLAQGDLQIALRDAQKIITTLKTISLVPTATISP